MQPGESLNPVPGYILLGEVGEWDCNFQVAINEMSVKVSESQEGHDVPALLGLRPVLDGLNFVQGHGKALGGQHISQVSAQVGVELAFVCSHILPSGCSLSN